MVPVCKRLAGAAKGHALHHASKPSPSQAATTTTTWEVMETSTHKPRACFHWHEAISLTDNSLLLHAPTTGGQREALTALLRRWARTSSSSSSSST